MDAFERYARAGLELRGIDLDDVELAVMRAAQRFYEPEMTALEEADLTQVWPEPDLNPSRAPSALSPASGAEPPRE